VVREDSEASGAGDTDSGDTAFAGWRYDSGDSVIAAVRLFFSTDAVISDPRAG
jgi:hypothetical protein